MPHKRDLQQRCYKSNLTQMVVLDFDPSAAKNKSLFTAISCRKSLRLHRRQNGKHYYPIYSTFLRESVNQKNGLHMLRYLGNFSWSVLEQLARALSATLIGILVIRYLGPSEFGELSYVLSVVTILSVVARYGLNEILVQELVDNPSEQLSILSNAVLFKLVWTAFALISANVLIYIFGTGDEKIFVLSIISVGIMFQGLDVIVFYYQANVNIKPMVFAGFVQITISSLIKILLIAASAHLEMFIFATAFDIFLLSASYFFMFRYVGKKHLKFIWRYESFKKYLIIGWPIAASNLAMIAYVRTDQIMLYHLAGSSVAGQYAAAAKISEAWQFIPALFTATLAPALLKKVNMITKNYRIMLSIVIYLSIICAATISISAPKLVSILLGSQFDGAASALALLVWSGVFISIGKVTIRWCVANNYKKLFLLKSVLGLALNLLLNFIFIPMWGAEGAGLATLISFAISDILIFLVLPPLRPLFWVILGSLNPRHLFQLRYLSKEHQ